MLQATITVAGQDFNLPPEQDVHSIMESITQQVRAGGGFVEIRREPDRTVSVLVSPGMNLSIELRSMDEDPVEELPVLHSWLDPDEWWKPGWGQARAPRSQD